jgi:hypothetical protein
MKSLGEFTKITANARMNLTSDMIEDIQGDKELMYEINEQPKPLSGFKMPTPHVMLSKNKEAYVDRGTIKLKEKVLDPFNFPDFVFCYSVGRDAANDRADCD